MYPVFDSSNMAMVEELLAQFEANPESVGAEWKAYFMGWLGANDVSLAQAAVGTSSASEGGDVGMRKAHFMRAWRKWGHVAARLDPLSGQPEVPQALTPETFGLKESDLDDLCKKVRAIYSDTVGVEAGVVNDPAERAWVLTWWEGAEGAAKPDDKTRKELLRGLIEANALEQYLHKKFVGAKRFSVEGNDAIIPLINWMADELAGQGGKNLVMGMAHRGRLNALCHVVGKPYAELLAAFADKLVVDEGHGPRAGDVKYHLGRKITRKSGVEVELLYNPSHLEAVNPMVLGLARAKGDKLNKERTKVLPVLLHGDSAVAGQGIVAECNNMSTVRGYYVGGCIHVVLNNQVGFTANPADAFGGKYCTDIFRSLGTPIVHVNADDMDACWKVLKFALAYRQKFGKDVAVDMVGYRRWGHNEGDDPTFTQPVLYAKIKNHPVPADVYAVVLEKEGVVSAADYAKMQEEVAAKLDKAYEEAMSGKVGHSHADHHEKAKGDSKTAVADKAITATVKAWESAPKGFTIHPKIAKVVEERIAMLKGEKPLNWGAAETTAYATLLQEGFGWRLTGQDVKRGTFSHRNAVLTDEQTGERWDVLAPLAAKDATYCVENSVLSENAVLGFEYGYALDGGKNLVQWEAQFGDFANGAQVVIDQFIASAKAKWDQDNDVAVLLPHGYEGQGPEHSSARVERFLQLCAENNMRVCMPTTPAQTFHLLRRQAKSGVKMPLIMFTPKSLLRLPAAVSDVKELTEGTWQPVIADTVETRDVKKLVLCTGKIYYDLLAARNDLVGEAANALAIVRVEELYPWPAKEIAAIVDQYKTKNVYWVQEEHRNMGAWAHVHEYWGEVNSALKEEKYLHYIGRDRSASPAAGTTKLHAKELAAVMERVLDGVGGKRKVA